MNQEDLLNMVRAEKSRAIGFDDDSISTDLQEKRVRALNYYAGDLSIDMPSLPNRSYQCSSDVQDVINMALPDLVEMFMVEEVASFVAKDDKDQDAADQETDYINWVVRKDGYNVYSTAFKDACLLGLGIFTWHWEEPKEPMSEDFENVTLDEVLNAVMTTMDSSQHAQMDPNQQANPVALFQQQAMDRISNVKKNDDGSYNFTMTQPQPEGQVVIKAFPPNDFCVSDDTPAGKPGHGTYCALRSRVRRQDLYMDGFDQEVVDSMPSLNGYMSDVEQARSLNGESDTQFIGQNSTPLDIVQIVYHYINVVENGNKQLYEVITGGKDCSYFLSAKPVDRVNASTIVPFPVPHRFYGQSLSEQVEEIQRIKTALLRMGLDQGYFAMNQRFEVAQQGATKNTLPDILNNVPGAPVRVKQTGTVKPIEAGSLNFNVWEAFELMNNVREERSGVARNAMGIETDSMHETKGGLLAMMSQSQRRIRDMARNFAETGVKEMYLGVHDLIRQNATIAQQVKLSGTFVPIDPTSWSLRDQMEVQIANAGGRDFDLMNLQAVGGLIQQAVEAQQGIDGDVVGPLQLINYATDFAKKASVKGGEKYFKTAQDYQQKQQQAQQQPPQPPPELAKIQMDNQLAQQKAQNEFQLKQQIAQMEFQHKQTLDSANFQHDRQMALMNMQLENDKAMGALQLQSAQVDAELDLKRRQQDLETMLGQRGQDIDAAQSQQDMHFDHAKAIADTLHAQTMDVVNQAHDQMLDANDQAHGQHMAAHAQLHDQALAQDAHEHKKALTKDQIEQTSNVSAPRPGGDADK